MKIKLLGLALVGILGVAAFADDKKTTEEQKAFDDTSFLSKAASGGMMEVELGKLAASRAKSEEVRKFGQKMVDDHTKANEELKAVAKKVGVSIPEKMNDEHHKMHEKFQNLTGDDFDKMYVQHMVKDHEHDVADFKTASKQAKAAEIRDFATKTLPTLEEHLTMIKKLNETIK